MNYIILDMEWNQPMNPKMIVRNPITFHAEVVQIGAVKLDDSFNEVDTFTAYISPKFYKKMHRKVQSLTKITSELLKVGNPFPHVYDSFTKWCGEEYIFLTWGPDDIQVLKDNLIVHSIDLSTLPASYNLQLIFDRQITKENRQISLARALEIVEETGAEAHNALGDAKSTALICRHIDIAKGIEEYNTSKQNNSNQAKDIWEEDSVKLYNSKRQAFKDREVTAFNCEQCGTEIICDGIVRQNAGKSIATGKCTCGEEYFIKFKFFRRANGKLKVRRHISPMTTELNEFYLEKKEINDRFYKKRSSCIE